MFDLNDSSAFDKVHFGFDDDAKVRLDVFTNELAEMLNLLAGGSAAIDEDEGLFFPDSGVSDGASLPATGFDEPSRRHLDAVLDGIARSIGMRLFDFSIFFLADHGIHEE